MYLVLTGNHVSWPFPDVKILHRLEAVRYSFAIHNLHDLTVSKRYLGAIAEEAVGKVNLADSLSVRDIESPLEVLEVSHV